MSSESDQSSSSSSSDTGGSDTGTSQSGGSDIGSSDTGGGSAEWSPPSGSDSVPEPAASAPYEPPPADANPYAPPSDGFTSYAPPADPYAPPTGPYPPSPGPSGAVPYAYPGQWAGAPAPYGQPYWTGPQAPPQGSNGLAIASLVLGILGFGCCLWALGLGFGIAALGQIRRRPQRGRGLAIAGIVLSCVWAVLTIGLAGVFVAKGDLDDIADRTNVFSLTPGDCTKESSGDHGAVVRRFTVVPCTLPHLGEVFGTVTLPDDQGANAPYPGDKVLQDAVAKECVQRQYEYVADYLAIPREVDVTTLYPDPTAWKSGGKRLGLCVFESKENLTRTLRQETAGGTGEQRSYLAASRELNQVLDQWPMDEPEDADPGVYQEWARKLVSAAQIEKSQLNAAQWSDPVRAQVAPLQAELDQVIAHAEKLRKTADTGAQEDEVLELEDLARGPADTRLRTALKLPTSAQAARPATV
ncbi:hypothetical protein KCMC57_up02460 [Kitasatospora sp. CMC57]|uniref:DUF4190 domain-containing protein n=1 Tax=Kitasatospora sp. CMC57 TaxID=3231513 RepID=A0AB33JWW9_9ACTN